MTKPDEQKLSPCPFCSGTDYHIIPGGQTWRGVKGYSNPQYFHLYHNGRIPEGDGFQNCSVQLRCRTEDELLVVWNTRAAMPDTITLEAKYREGFDDGCAHIKEDYAAGERLDKRAAMPDTTVEEAATVLLDNTPNPIFDTLKYPMMGEFKQSIAMQDEDGDEVWRDVTIEWTTIKDIISAALNFLAKTREGKA